MKISINYLRFLAFTFLTVAIVAANSCKKDSCDKDLDGKIYVANEIGGSVSIIDAGSLEVVETVDLTYKGIMYMAHNIQVAADGQSVWITAIPMHDDGDEYVMVIRRKSKKVKEYISVGGHQHVAHVVLDNESKYAYVTSNEKGEVVKIDAEKFEVTHRFGIGTGSLPHGLRYMNDKLYIACMGSKMMVQMDAVTGMINTIPVGGIAVQTAVCPILNSVFVSVYDLKQVVRYDVATGDTTQIQLPVGSEGPIQLYPSPDNSRVYVCDQGIVNGNPSSNKLYVIDTGTNAVVSTVIVGNGAHGVAVNADGSKIFVTNVNDNTVSVVEASTLTVIKTIGVGEGPNGISVLDCE